MKREFVVTNGEGDISWSAKSDKAEKFSTWKAAKARASEIAQSEPGSTVSIYELTAQTTCAVAAPETSRKHPFEHYA